MPSPLQSASDILAIKKAVRCRDGLRCTECGMTAEEHITLTGRNLDVHRLSPGSEYSLEGCVTLCRSCHGPKPRRSRGQADLGSPRNGKNLNFWLDEDVSAAFQVFLTSLEIQPTTTRTVEVVLKEFLSKRGFWPPRSVVR